MNSLKTFLFTIATSYLLTLSTVTFAQHNPVDWLNKNAHALHTDSTATDQDLRFLSKLLKDKALVGLGEASHGTQEFYFQKRRIINYLISQDRYRLIALEFPASYIEPINHYVQTGKGDLKSMFKALGLYNSDELYKLCLWLKSFNDSRSPGDRVKMIGFDNQEYWSDPLTRDKKMAENFIRAHKQDKVKSILWAHNLHLAKDTTMAQYKAMGFHLKKEYGDRYYVIGFDTYSGSVNVLNNGQFERHNFEGKENTFSALFSKANIKTFFVDFDKVPHPFIDKVNSITNIYSDWRESMTLPIIPGADFDGLIFIKETTASKDVK